MSRPALRCHPHNRPPDHRLENSGPTNYELEPLDPQTKSSFSLSSLGCFVTEGEKQRWVTNKNKQTKKLVEQHSYQRQKETVWTEEVPSIKHLPLKQQTFSDTTWEWGVHDAGDVRCWGRVIRGVWCRVCVMLGVQMWGYVMLGVCDAGCADPRCVRYEIVWCWVYVIQSVCDAGCVWCWVSVVACLQWQDSESKQGFPQNKRAS